MRTLAALVAEHPDQELERNQPGVVDGLAVTVKCALARTAVVVREGEPARLVKLALVNVEETVRWVHQTHIVLQNKSRDRGRALSRANHVRPTACSICGKERDPVDLERQPGRRCRSCVRERTRQRRTEGK